MSLLLPGNTSTPKRQLVIEKITIVGNQVTRRSVILRELNIHTGDLVYADSLDDLIEENKLRLFNIQLFNEVDQEILPKNDSAGIEWVIRVKERFPYIPNFYLDFADRNVNTWWVEKKHDLHRLTAGVRLVDKNFRGNLENLSLTFQGGYTQKVGISYVRPYIDPDQVHGIGFNLSVSRSRQTYYATDSDKLVYYGNYHGPAITHQLNGGISYIYRPGYAARHIVQLNYGQYSVGDTVMKLNPGYFADNSRFARFVEFFYRFEFNHVDNWNYSLTGFKLVFVNSAKQGFQGLDFLNASNVEAGFFQRLLPGWYVSEIFRGRLQFPQLQPYFFRGGLGTQTDYVRGYEYYVIDGDSYGLLRLDLKREICNKTFSFPNRYLSAVPLRIYPKIFADAGYINNNSPGNNFLCNRMLYSYGAGFDIVSLYDMKIRVEFTENQLNQAGIFFHFNSE